MIRADEMKIVGIDKNGEVEIRITEDSHFINHWLYLSMNTEIERPYLIEDHELARIFYAAEMAEKGGIISGDDEKNTFLTSMLYRDDCHFYLGDMGDNRYPFYNYDFKVKFYEDGEIAIRFEENYGDKEPDTMVFEVTADDEQAEEFRKMTRGLYTPERLQENRRTQEGKGAIKYDYREAVRVSEKERASMREGNEKAKDVVKSFGERVTKVIERPLEMSEEEIDEINTKSCIPWLEGMTKRRIVNTSIDPHLYGDEEDYERRHDPEEDFKIKTSDIFGCKDEEISKYLNDHGIVKIVKNEGEDFGVYLTEGNSIVPYKDITPTMYETAKENVKQIDMISDLYKILYQSPLDKKINDTMRGTGKLIRGFEVDITNLVENSDLPRNSFVDEIRGYVYECDYGVAGSPTWIEYTEDLKNRFGGVELMNVGFKLKVEPSTQGVKCTVEAESVKTRVKLKEVMLDCPYVKSDISKIIHKGEKDELDSRI